MTIGGVHIAVRVLSADVQKQLALANRDVDRATMWTLREAGRKARQRAAKAAPVYQGRVRDRWVKGQRVGPILPRDLKRSIRSARRLKRIPGGYSLTVAPRGVPTVYASRQEARTPFMAPALTAVEAEMPLIAARAWERSLRRHHL